MESTFRMPVFGWKENSRGEMVKPLNYFLAKSFHTSCLLRVTSAAGEKHLQILVELNILIPAIVGRQVLLFLVLRFSSLGLIFGLVAEMQRIEPLFPFALGLSRDRLQGGDGESLAGRVWPLKGAVVSSAGTPSSCGCELYLLHAPETQKWHYKSRFRHARSEVQPTWTALCSRYRGSLHRKASSLSIEWQRRAFQVPLHWSWR